LTPRCIDPNIVNLQYFFKCGDRAKGRSAKFVLEPVGAAFDAGLPFFSEGSLLA
jgi:hypothetical protein